LTWHILKESFGGLPWEYLILAFLGVYGIRLVVFLYGLVKRMKHDKGKL